MNSYDYDYKEALKDIKPSKELNGKLVNDLLNNKVAKKHKKLKSALLH